MLTIKCATCKRKLWKYEKFGSGEVLRCYKSRIDRMYDFHNKLGRIVCFCGTVIGIDKGSYIKMIKKGFIYSGRKQP